MGGLTLLIIFGVLILGVFMWKRHKDAAKKEREEMVVRAEALSRQQALSRRLAAASEAGAASTPSAARRESVASASAGGFIPLEEHESAVRIAMLEGKNRGLERALQSIG